MTRKLNLMMCSLFVASSLCAQTYVNEMLQADIERDCYIEGGAASFNDNATKQYDDPSYVQKASADTPTSFIFNREIWGNKNLTGFKINMLIPKDRPDKEAFIKIEYSLDEMNYKEIPDMIIDESYEATLGTGYWTDLYYQAALPAGTKEIKVTLLAMPDVANWIPCYRRTEIFYEGATPYQYVTPPYIQTFAESFNLDFESDNYLLELGGQNATSTAEVVTNPFPSGINTSNNVLKIVQDPSSSDWGWGNADWFGVAMALKDGEGKQATKITAKGRYLNFMIHKPESTLLGMETWGGTCTYKDQAITYASKGEWQMVTIDLNDYTGTTFETFYFSPNELFGTNSIAVAETTYIDNVYISDVSSVNDIEIDTTNKAKVIGEKGSVSIIGASGMAVNIYTFTGSLIHSSIMAEDAGSISMDAGIYIVKVGNEASKIKVY